MANFGLIVICLSLGLILKRVGKLPRNAHVVLNTFVMSIALPAVALLNLHDLVLDSALFFPMSMAWMLFGLGLAVFVPLGRALGWSRHTQGALILTGALSNTSFVGFPLLVALYGESAIQTGIIADQPGSFLVLSTLGMLTASMLSSNRLSLAKLPGKLLRFPPFVAMLVAFALHPIQYPAVVRAILERLSATLIPLALVSVGLQLDFNLPELRKNLRPLSAGLLFKLILGPAVIAALDVGVFGGRGQTLQITIAEAAMAPMITGAILASDHGLDPELANLMIAIGTPLSLLTVPVWAWALRGL